MSDEKRDEAVATAPTTTAPAETAAPTSDPVAKDHAVSAEKDNILQHEHTHSDGGAPSDELKHKLTLHETIDLENRGAFKGDDSDGKIEWTFRKVRLEQRVRRGDNGHRLTLVSLPHRASWLCCIQVGFPA